MKYKEILSEDLEAILISIIDLILYLIKDGELEEALQNFKQHSCDKLDCARNTEENITAMKTFIEFRNRLKKEIKIYTKEKLPKHIQ